MTRDQDILPRIVALLLNLAMLAEQAASRPPAVRRAILSILLSAQHAALTLLPADDAAPLQPADLGIEPRALLHLAASLRAIAALLLHVCLNGGEPAPHRQRDTTEVFSRTLPVGPSLSRFPGRVVHDTS